MTDSTNDNSPDDDERVAPAIRTSIETLDPSTKIDGHEVAHWPSAKFPDHPIEWLIAAVKRHCEAFVRMYR